MEFFEALLETFARDAEAGLARIILLVPGNAGWHGLARWLAEYCAAWLPGDAIAGVTPGRMQGCVVRCERMARRKGRGP